MRYIIVDSERIGIMTDMEASKILGVTVTAVKSLTYPVHGEKLKRVPRELVEISVDEDGNPFGEAMPPRGEWYIYAESVYKRLRSSAKRHARNSANINGVRLLTARGFRTR